MAPPFCATTLDCANQLQHELNIPCAERILLVIYTPGVDWDDWIEGAMSEACWACAIHCQSSVVPDFGSGALAFPIFLMHCLWTLYLQQPHLDCADVFFCVLPSGRRSYLQRMSLYSKVQDWGEMSIYIFDYLQYIYIYTSLSLYMCNDFIKYLVSTAGACWPVLSFSFCADPNHHCSSDEGTSDESMDDDLERCTRPGSLPDCWY